MNASSPSPSSRSTSYAESSAEQFIPSTPPVATQPFVPVTRAFPSGASAEAIQKVAYSPDGKTIAQIGKDISLWDARTGKLRKTIKADRPTAAFAFSPDGKTIAARNDAKTVALWNVASGKRRLALTVPSDPVSLAFSHDGKLLATGGRNLIGKAITLWNLRTGKVVRKWGDTKFAIDYLCFSPRDNTLVSSSVYLSNESTARLSMLNHVSVWNADTGVRQHSIEVNTPLEWIAFSADGATITTAGSTVQQWDVASSTLKRSFDTAQMQQSGWWIALSPDGNLLASLRSNTIEVRRADNLALQCTLASEDSAEPTSSQSRPDSGFTSVAFAPDARTLVTTGGRQGVKLWDARTGKFLRAFSASHSHPHNKAAGP